MEQYFGGEEENNTSDYVLEGLMRSLIDNGRLAIKNPTNYEVRSNIMWSATMALNKITGLSKEQDWEVHMIEHQLGAYTDCAHGIGLAIISIPYYNYIYPYGIDKFVKFAKNVWNVNVDNMSEEEYSLFMRTYAEIVIQMVRELIPDMKYQDAKTQLIQLDEGEDGLLVINDDDWARINETLVYYP
jgi:alcohol dehydrogenase YqhD (iron-dependent ADH family)